MTFRRALAFALLPKLFVLALAFAWFAPSLISPTWEKGTDEQVMALRPPAEGSPAALVAEHDCWTGEAPTDATPSRAVVTVDGVTRVGGERIVGKALAQLFDGADHGLVVHGLCR
jgi:hypothetical protein